MSRLKIAAIAVASLLTFGVAATSAQDAFVAPATPEAAVAAREMLMKSNGATLKAAGALSGPEAVAAMQTMLDNFTNMAAVFPEGSNVGDSKASPAIWQNWDAFTTIIDSGKSAAADGLAGAETGDGTAYGAALKAMGGTCGTCHQQFRIK
jgi:cytochrome c556